MLATLDEDAARHAAASKIRTLTDIQLPHLKYWNYEPCAHHDVPDPLCDWDQCGGELFPHQKVGVSWAFLERRGLIADDPGLGKTGQVLALVAMIKEKFGLVNRAVVFAQTGAVLQWVEQANRWTRGVHTEAVIGSMTVAQRNERYAANWDLLIVGSHISIKDKKKLDALGPFDLVVSDDVDAILDEDNATHRVVREVSEAATWAFTINATALQTKILQLHAAMLPVGGGEYFGTRDQFEREYIRKELVRTRDKRGVARDNWQSTGTKNLNKFRAIFYPHYLRRRADQIDGLNMPALMPPSTVYLEMSKIQQEKYTELQQGILRLIQEGGEKVKNALDARTRWGYGQQICAGLPALGEADGPGASPKLDWLLHRLTTVWTENKIIVFAKNPNLVRAAQARLDNVGIGYATVWGQKQNAFQRDEQVNRFRHDKKVRVMLGTPAIERSLNLQVANTLVAIDTHLNPARMRQILGRGRRAGSKHAMFYMFTLLMANTQEEKYMKKLSERAGLYDAVFDEMGDMYEALSALELNMMMIP